MHAYDLTATISYVAPNDYLVTIERAGVAAPLDTARLGGDEDPVSLLRGLGYEIAYPTQRSMLARVVRAIGYAKCSLVPAAR